MTSVRRLRSEAAASLKRARSLCHVVTKEARLVARTRCEMLKVSELREAKKACDELYETAERARRAYVRARPVESKAKRLARERTSERKALARADAIARVMDEHGIPEDVATAAVRRAERRGKLPRPTDPRRWEMLADRTTGSDIAAAWDLVERRMGASRPTKKRKAKRKAAPPPEVVVLVDPSEFADDGDAYFEVSVP